MYLTVNHCFVFIFQGCRSYRVYLAHSIKGNHLSAVELHCNDDLKSFSSEILVFCTFVSNFGLKSNQPIDVSLPCQNSFSFGLI